MVTLFQNYTAFGRLRPETFAVALPLYGTFFRQTSGNLSRAKSGTKLWKVNSFFAELAKGNVKKNYLVRTR